MKKLINMMFAGKSINTSKGNLTFDKEGTCLLEDEVADAFKSIKGFTVENDAENNDNSADEKDSDKNLNTPENKSNAAEDDEENAQEFESHKEENKNEESGEVEKPIDFKSLTVPALKKYARDNKINITGLEKKDQIIEAIKNQN